MRLFLWNKGHGNNSYDKLKGSEPEWSNQPNVDLAPRILKTCLKCLSWAEENSHFWKFQWFGRGGGGIWFLVHFWALRTISHTWFFVRPLWFSTLQLLLMDIETDYSFPVNSGASSEKGKTSFHCIHCWVCEDNIITCTVSIIMYTNSLTSVGWSVCVHSGP
jgi:hypothetical protein